MNDELPATIVSTYAYCPRRATYREAGPVRLECDAFATVVRRALQIAANVRIAKEPYDLAYVVRKLMRECGVENDAELFERARTVTRFGLQKLFEFEPVIADAAFGATVAGLRVGGSVDLVARRADRTPIVFAFRTSAVPDTAFAIELALARGGVADTFPNAVYAILDVGERDAAEREAALPDGARLERFVRDAVERTRDEPRPGAYCASCEVLAACPEGRARSGAQGV